MAEAAAHARAAASVRPAPARRKGVLWCLAVSLVLSVAVEWIGMTFVWPELGSRHAEEILLREAGYLHGDFAAAASRVGRWGGRGYYWAFERTGIESGAMWLGERAGVSEYVAAGFAMVQVFVVRLVLLAFSAPSFALFGLVGLASGLTLRDVRRWSAGREFGGVYHKAKRIAPAVLKLAAVVYLAVPVAVHPTAVIVPGAMLFGAMVALVASTFKKYL